MNEKEEAAKKEAEKLKAESMGRTDKKDIINSQGFADNAIRNFFRVFVMLKFERDWQSFHKIYFDLAEEFPIGEIGESGTYSCIRDTSDEAAADFAESAIIDYFDKTADKKFVRRFIEESCSLSEIKRAGDVAASLTSNPGYREWKKAVERVKRSDMLLLYLWSDKRCDDDAMKRTLAAAGQRMMSPKIKDKDAAVDAIADAQEFSLKRAIMRKLRRKLGMSLEDAIYDCYCDENPSDPVLALLPEMDQDALRDACKSASYAVCEAITTDAAYSYQKVCNAPISAPPKLESFVQYDTQQAVKDGVFLAAVFAVMGQAIELSHDYLEEKRKNYKMTEPAIMKESQREVNEAKAEKNRLEKELKKAVAENETLKKRAEQAETRMRRQKHKPDDAQKKAGDEIRKLRRMSNRLLEEKNDLERKNEKLRKEIELLQEAYADQPTAETSADIDTQARYLFVTDKDIMIRKLRTWFPNSVISGEKHVKTLSGVKMVIFVCAEVSHSEYYRVKAMARAAGIETLHCNRISYSAICDCIRSHGKQYGQ